MISKRFLRFTFALLIINLVAPGTKAQKMNNDYNQEWQKVKKAEDKGLTESALKEVNVIYNLAKKDKNEVQIIKSLLYKNLLYQNLTEDATVKMIDTMELETISAPEPAKSILQSITAQLYQNYVSYNRYRLYSVSNTTNFEKKDIATWSMDDFRNMIASLYESSIQNKQLRNISLDAFEAILERGNARNLRPTLFDLLAHRALEYFKDSENDLSRPSYFFEINDAAAFAPAEEFIKVSFESRDSNSLYLKALHLYQELIEFHLRDMKPLVDVDLERLEFVNQHAVIPDKQALYIAALKNIFETRKDESAAEAGFRWAREVRESANQVDKKKEAASVLEAITILKSVISRYPESTGAVKASNYLNEIRHPALSVTTEKVNVINKPFRALVSFRNLKSIHLRLIPVTREQKEYIRKAESSADEFKRITALRFTKSWQQALPDTKDFIEHTTEIKIDGLPSGEYILLAAMNSDFSTGKNLMAANFFFVSNISYVNNGADYFVLDRESGRPIPNASARIMLKNYDHQARKYNLINAATVQSDKEGYFRIPDKVPFNAYNMQLDVTSGKDRLFLDDLQRTYRYDPVYDMGKYETQEELDKETARIFFFSDRSIYRPGQEVYYKGIAITRDLKTGKWQLLYTGKSLTVYLYNSNNEKADSTKVTLNEYGSFHGKFRLPDNQLTGNFYIKSSGISRGSLSFSVEDYKRPKFFAEFKKAEETFKVNDTVSITGFAEAYAGNRVDGAQVSYRVVREARFIYPWYFWRTPLPQISPLEITHGTATTNDKGEFTIKFKAIPDLKLDPATDPVFDYRITADITDINGETRSTSMTVPIGYKALNLQISIANKTTLLAGTVKEIGLRATNLSGQPQEIKARLKIYRLKTPDRILRERLWPAPDTSVMTKEEFIRYFPHDVYRDEDNPETWQKSTLVQDLEDSVKGSAKIKVAQNLSSGWYLAEAESEDRYGNRVKDVRYFRVLQPEDKKPDLPDYLVAISDKKEAEPGENVKIYLASATGIHLIRIKDTIQTSKKKPHLTFTTHELNNEIRSYNFPVTEEDLGGFGVIQFFIKNNRFYYTKTNVDVPWNNKKLDVTFDTYREKTLPGSSETWNVKITGHKGEKVAAEILTSMYDESLDQFRPHAWSPLNIWPVYTSYNNWQGSQNFSAIQSFDYLYSPAVREVRNKSYDQLDFLIKYSSLAYGSRVIMKRETLAAPTADMRISGNAPPEELNEVVMVADSVSTGEQTQPETTPESNPIRTNFNETAFFFPDLKTDAEGHVIFSFTMPEALTKWKWMTFAHTSDLASGYAATSVVTQKDLMVMPNVPRFMREGDQMDFSAKVVNMSDREMTATVSFHLLNADTKLPVDSWFKNNDTAQSVTIPANQSKAVRFHINVPDGFNNLVTYQIIARTDNMSDGEEAYIPVVTNRMLVTESMPLEMSGTGTKRFSFEKLLKSGQSKSLTNFGLTVEYTPNPAWYAVQALPYLNEYPYECTEQVFNRYFANALAMQIANSSPKLKAVFEKWKTTDTAALMSNLQKNQELKSVLLEETPWVMQAKNEEEQKKNIALLFDLHNMTSQLDKSLKTVAERQSANGGFVWFKDGPDDRYMTQYIISDMGHLKKLQAWPQKNVSMLNAILKKAIPYLDNRIYEDYQKLKKSKTKMDDNNLSYIAIHYLYTRSFFPDMAVSAKAQEAYNYYLGQARKYWLSQSIYMQGMIALTVFRNGDSKTASSITASLKENAIKDATLGMYWKAWSQRSWWWYQAPIESQSLMIEVFSEIKKDVETVNELKKWLLKNKQTYNWKTTKATAEAVYALLLEGSDWLAENNDIRISLGQTVFNSREEKQQEGTGYFKRRIDGANVKPSMGNISVTVSPGNTKAGNPSLSWGSVYWQYFEDLDKITNAETPLRLTKKLFVEKNTDKGPVLTPVNEGDVLKPGDKIKVRIELRADRDMEYVHMKDMRASAMEPINVLSGYRWQGGLGYYESTRDASTNFFFNRLPRGTYVFEYGLFVTHAGDFSNGITTIQSMYAPEFAAHSEGVRIRVKEN